MKIREKTESESQDKIISDFIIDKTFVPGVTVTASNDPIYRYKFNEQIAFSKSKGEDFLGAFETEQQDVFMMLESEAEYSRIKKSLTNQGISESHLKIATRWSESGSYLFIEPDSKNINSCSYNPSGIIGLLKAYLDEHKECKVIILPDFKEIVTHPKTYIENLFNGTSPKISPEEMISSFHVNSLLKDRERENMRGLRNLASKYNASIISGCDLSQKDELSNSYGAKFADNRIYIIERKKGLRLQIKKCRYVATSSWDMEYNDYTGFWLTPEGRDRVKKLSLNKKDKQIIDFIFGKGRLRQKDIDEGTGIAHSTVKQKLDELQTEKKGKWVVRHPDGTYELIRKDRPWHDDAK